MEQKVKLAVIGLAGLLLVSFIIILQVNGSKQSLERQVDKLNSENVSLRSQVDGAALEKRGFEERINSVKTELDKTTQEREELQKQFDLADRAKEDLLEQIKSLKKKSYAAPAQPQMLSLPQSDDAYWGQVLTAKKDLEMQVDNLRVELRNLQINNEQLQREKAALDLDMKSLIREKEDLKRQIDYNQKIVDGISADLVREKNDKTQIQISLNTIKSDNAMLRRQAKLLGEKKIALETRIALLQEKNKGLQAKAEQIDEKLEEKVSQIGEARNKISSAGNSSVELPAIVVRPKSDNVVKDINLLAKVIAINRENNFIVVDLGEESGLKVGDNLRVYKADKHVASVQVIEVRKSISACDIKNESQKIVVGDLVK